MIKTKPPLELMPEWRWKELIETPTYEDLKSRMDRIQSASFGYRTINKPVPASWGDELENIRLEIEVAEDKDNEQ